VEALSDDNLADITFIVGPERKNVRGLRIVMAARNKNLRHMLYEDRNEDGTLKNTFVKPNVHGPSFELMMRFIHSGGLSWEPHQTVQLLEVAIDFEVTELISKCMELIADSMTESLSLLELTKLIQILLKGEGFDVNLQHPKTGTSALHIASREGGLELVKDLIARNANVNGVDSAGATALHLAKSAEVAQVLIEHKSDVNLADYGGNTPLVYALVRKRADVKELLIGMGCHGELLQRMQLAADLQTEALSRVAAAQEHKEWDSLMESSIKRCTTPEDLLRLIVKEAELYPPLISPPSLVEAAKAGSVWGTRSALTRGDDVNQRDEKEAARLAVLGYTSLHWAAAMGHLEVVQCLLAADDIDINPSDTEDDAGYTPYQLCRNYQQRQWQQCMALMEAHGATLWPLGDDDLEEEAEGGNSSKHNRGSHGAGNDSGGQTRTETRPGAGVTQLMTGLVHWGAAKSKIVTGGASIRHGGVSALMRSTRQGGNTSQAGTRSHTSQQASQLSRGSQSKTGGGGKSSPSRGGQGPRML